MMKEPITKLQACDLMTNRVAGIHPKASLRQAIELMLDFDVSGLPVIDISGTLVGMLTCSDILRRSSVKEHCAPPARAARIFDGIAEIVATIHWQIVEDVMTPELCTVQEDAPLAFVARRLKDRKIKRLPVLRGDMLVGMIHRADLTPALGEDFDAEMHAATAQDYAIKDMIFGVLHSLQWTPSPLIDVAVDAGDVELCGTLLKEKDRAALRSAIETIPGVRSYTDRLILAEAPRDMFVRFVEDIVSRPKLYC